MNERIENLAKQCRIETYGVNGELLTFGFDEEKFAALVAAHEREECAALCMTVQRTGAYFARLIRARGEA